MLSISTVAKNQAGSGCFLGQILFTRGRIARYDGLALILTKDRRTYARS